MELKQLSKLKETQADTSSLFNRMHQAPQGAIGKVKGLATPLLSLVNASLALLLQ